MDKFNQQERRGRQTNSKACESNPILKTTNLLKHKIEKADESINNKSSETIPPETGIITDVTDDEMAICQNIRIECPEDNNKRQVGSRRLIPGETRPEIEEDCKRDNYITYQGTHL